jgi:hypothetical protein
LSRDGERFKLPNMILWKITLNWIAAVVGVIAALLWYRSATVRVPANTPEPHEHGMYPPRIAVNASDFIATAEKQTQWNKSRLRRSLIAGLRLLRERFPRFQQDEENDHRQHDQPSELARRVFRGARRLLHGKVD